MTEYCEIMERMLASLLFVRGIQIMDDLHSMNNDKASLEPQTIEAFCMRDLRI